MAVQKADYIWRDYEVDGVSASGYHMSVPREIRKWGTWVENGLQGASAGATIYGSKADMEADTSQDANAMAWVLGDDTAANNGIYQFDGTDTWTRLGDLPYSYIVATNAGAGTADAIEATTSVPIPAADGGALIALPIVADNTSETVTVVFNGGDALTIKTASGNDPAVGGLKEGMIVDGYVSGSGTIFRLRTDQASAAIQAAAEEAQAAAEDAQAAAEAAAAGVTGLTFPTLALASAYTPESAPDFLRTAGYSSAGDGGGALYKKVAAEPSHDGKFSITLSDGETVVWYEIAEEILTERMFGVVPDGNWDGTGTDNATALQNWADCTVSLKKRFTGCSKTTAPIQFPAGTIIDMADLSAGIDGSAITDMNGAPAVVYVDQSSKITKLTATLSDDLTSRTEIPLTDASGVEAGDWTCLYNPTDGSWITDRTTYQDGEWFRVAWKDDDTLIPTAPLWHLYDAADVDLYLHKGPQVVLRGFKVLGPYLETACVKVEGSISPIIENIDTRGTHYAGILLARCIDEYVNCNLFQPEDTGTVGNEYGLAHISCHGGEIHGNYHAQRHGITFGNTDVECCVPNRLVRVYANTSCADGVGSLDFGHGCSEGLEMLGGTHTGVMLGGANHRFVGGLIRKAEGHGSSTRGGLLVSGSEFYGGTFIFDGTAFESLAAATSSSVGPIELTLQDGIKQAPKFIFRNCCFRNAGGNTYFVRLWINGCTFEPELIITDPVIEDVSDTFSYFLWLRWISGEKNWGRVVITGVVGMADDVPRCFVDANGVTASVWTFDPQQGTASIAGDTEEASATKAVTFSYSYPVGATPFVTVANLDDEIGGDAYISFPQSVTRSGFSAAARTCDGGNFASTDAGDVRWKAEF